MRAIRKHLALLLVLVVSLGLFSGCKPSESEYLIYYADRSESRLISYTLELDDAPAETQMMTLLTEMNTPRKGTDAVVIKPLDITVSDVTLKDKVATVSFEGDYSSMNVVTELLYRVAVIKELTQISGVEKVTFAENGSVLSDNDGNELSDMTASSYIDDSDNKGGNVEWRDINLYFADQDGTGLVRTTMTIAYNKNMSLEKIVVSKLLAGPTESGLQATIPNTVSVLSVSMRDGICYVNLSPSFLTDFANVSGALTIYSIVDSLCDLDTVDGVRILIDGSTTAVYQETITLDRTFISDLSYVKTDPESDS